MKRWEVIVDGYLKQCKTRGLADSTIYSREKELFRFGNWMYSRKPHLRIEDLTGEEIIAYLKTRSAFRCKVTIYTVVSRLRDMGEYLLSEGIWTQNPLRWIKGPKIDSNRKIPRTINQSHLTLIWEEVCSMPGEYQRILWLVVLSLLYGIGIRRGELERLEIDDWDRNTGLLSIDGRKTGRERCVPVPELAYKSLEIYLPKRHNQLSRFNCLQERSLLINHRGTPLRGEHISKGLRMIAKRAGIPRVTMHQFRHSCASDLLREGVGLCKIQHILGHAALSSTYRYAHVSDPARKKAIESHPVNRMLLHTKER